MDADAARAAATSFGRFAWDEVKATLRAFGRVGGGAWLVGTLGIFVAFLASGATVPPGQSRALACLVWLVACAYYAALPALVLGGVAATWRHLGWSVLLPVLTLPAVTAGVLTLGEPLFVLAARSLVRAFQEAADAYHWPALQAVGRLAHAGALAVPFVLVAVIVDGVHLLGDGRVVWALLKLVGLMAALGAAAVAGTVALTAPPMVWVFVRRSRVRWAAWRQTAGEAVAP